MQTIEVIKLLLKLGNEVPEGKYLIKGSSFIHSSLVTIAVNDVRLDLTPHTHNTHTNITHTDRHEIKTTNFSSR
jgi:hypothetical protein